MAISKAAIKVGMQLRSTDMDTCPLSPITVAALTGTGFLFNHDVLGGGTRRGEFFTHGGKLHGYAVVEA